MLRLVLFLVILPLCGRWAAAAPIKVYVISGQSNAVGGGYTIELPASLNVSQNSLYQYRLIVNTDVVDSTAWGALRPKPESPPHNLTYGIELTFGRAMEQRTGDPVAIIKVGANGTGLWNRWLPARNDLYPWMMDKIDAALGQLETLGYQPDVSGFLWIQGENDAGYATHSAAYDDNLAALASALRTDLNEPNLPFVLNQAHAQLNRAFTASLRASQQNAADLDPNMLMINADDLALREHDMTHFTGETFFELGRRFADALAPSGDFNDDGMVNAADLTLWRASVGSTRVGDGNADGVADGNDFLLWQRQLGYAPSLSTTASAAATAVPEPSSAAALFSLLLMALHRRAPWRRREI